MGLKLEHVSYLYGTDTELLVRALDDVNLEIPDGQFIGLIGHTGSGKSTLVQHLNGLLKPSEGTILFNGENIWAGVVQSDGPQHPQEKAHAGKV